MNCLIGMLLMPFIVSTETYFDVCAGTRICLLTLSLLYLLVTMLTLLTIGYGDINLQTRYVFYPS